MPPRPRNSSGFVRNLLGWFDRSRRELPWRSSRDPYAIWISEVMLQQTQVTTVIPYYERWLRRFPDVIALARARPDEVLAGWQGLGYYSRARSLHRAAMTVAGIHEGRLPRTSAGLSELPGFGPYTSGAVASIAFGERVPAVDGNVARVMARRLGLTGHSGDPALRAKVTGILESVIPADRPGDFNQALMELGATVCRPRNPKCDLCPVAEGCRSKGRAGASAPKAGGKRREPETLSWNAYAVTDTKGRLYLHRRPETGLFAGLWELPTDETGKKPPKGAEFLGEIHHRLTHRIIRLRVFRLKKLPAGDAGRGAKPFDRLPPVSTLTRKALALAES